VHALSMADLTSAPPHKPAGQGDVPQDMPDDTLGSTTLPSNTDDDVTPWLLHRLTSAMSIADELRQDAAMALQADLQAEAAHEQERKVRQAAGASPAIKETLRTD